MILYKEKFALEGNWRVRLFSFLFTSILLLFLFLSSSAARRKKKPHERRPRRVKWAKSSEEKNLQKASNSAYHIMHEKIPLRAHVTTMLRRQCLTRLESLYIYIPILLDEKKFSDSRVSVKSCFGFSSCLGLLSISFIL